MQAGSEIPAWAQGNFVSITRTAEELSIVCAADDVPTKVKAEREWHGLRVSGTLDFSLVGIVASLTVPLADAGIGVFVVSTFDTDYLFVRSAELASAMAALELAGHEVR